MPLYRYKAVNGAGATVQGEFDAPGESTVVDWLRDSGIGVIDLNSPECIRMLAGYIAAHPDVWNEDIGEES